MLKKTRIYDIVGTVIATLLATVLINNFKGIINFFSYSFQVRLSIAILTFIVVSYSTFITTKKILNRRSRLEVLERDKQIELLQTKLEEQTEEASKDKLTDTYNSNQAEKILLQRIEKAKEKNQPFIGLLIDIDNFKRINSNYGHEAGNAILRQIAYIIKPRSSDDVLIRYGGDEFLIFSRIGDTKENGYGLGQRLKREVSEFEFWVDNKNKTREKMTISCGICEYNILSDSKEKFLEKLSIALNFAKKNEDGSDKKNFVAILD